ncbi:hypothetical protein GQ600_23187 [Phytophthora cactorum]|nr:hypothetical protein GQ600_23187 [Phytophthora cactorum]
MDQERFGLADIVAVHNGLRINAAPSLLRSDGKLAFSSSFLLGLLAVTASTALYTINSQKTNNHKDKTDHATQVAYLPSTPLLGNTLEVVANTARFQDWISDHSQERDGQPFAIRLLGKNDIIYMAKLNTLSRC